jgi:polyhydroxyalkanoate synthase subunit PhaE
MNSTEHAKPEPQAMLLEWLKSANQFWAQYTPNQKSAPYPGEAQEKESRKIIQEALLSISKGVSAITSMMSDPSAMEAVYRGFAVLPDITSTFLQTGIKGYSSLQKQFAEKMGKLGIAEAYNFDKLDQEVLQAWSDIYRKEISQYFNIPQLGLTRFYQERANQAIDKYNLFNNTLSEFLHLLSLPFDKSLKAMQEKIEELTKSGGLPEDTRVYYQMWLKTLEGHFMKLFKSTKYNEALGETLAAMDDYLEARNRIIQDMLQSLPIPTSKEMDDLYLEVYKLKKSVRKLEKANGKA